MIQMIRRWAFIVVLLATPAALLMFLRRVPQFDPSWFSASGHLIVVAAIAACALFVAAVAVVSACQTPQAGVVWLALGCSLVGLLMLGHALSTPGAMDHHPSNQWVARLPYAAIVGFAACLFLAGRRQDRGVNRWVGRYPLASVVMPLVPAALVVAAVVVDPARLHGKTPIQHENTLLALVSTTVIVSLVVAMWRHGRRWHLGKDPCSSPSCSRRGCR